MSRHKKSFKHIRLGIGLAAVGLLLLSTLAPMLPAPKAAAATQIKLPIVWADNNHSHAVDGNNFVYYPVGYFCSKSSLDPVTSSDGTTIDSGSKPTGTIQAYKETEVHSNKIETIKIPACSSTGGGSFPASFIWTTHHSPMYALVVLPSVEPTRGGDPIINGDPQYRPIHQLTTGTGDAFVYQIDNGVLVDKGQRVNNITVDPSVADTVTKDEGDQSGQGHESNPTCETSGDPLTWILCPIYNGVAGLSDWLFSHLVQPLLRTAPISTDPSDKGYMIWSNFRVYGDIFLVIALLIIVFGQSLGGGLIDAYTTKKVLPRILAAAILINLSLYIVAFLVDVTNIVGGGIGQIITAPLTGAGAFNISLSSVQAGTIVGVPTIAAALGGIGLLLGAIPPLGWILLFLVMPAALGLLAAFVTLILRKAILLALLLVSPVAFALYCLPNTEQYFKKWWGLLLQTLMVYPIVIIIFAIADVLSVTVMTGNNKNDPITAIISFVLQFLPLFLIPYSFKLAGGALGKIHEVMTSAHKRGQEAIKGNPNDPTSLRNFYGHKYRSQVHEARVGLESSTRNSRSRLQRMRGRVIGGGALVQQKAAIENAERAKHMEMMWQNGDDSFPKAATIPESALNGRRRAYQNAVAGGMSVIDAERQFRYQTATAAGNNTGMERWSAADGTWFTEPVIKQANHTYESGSDKQTNFRMLLGKTEPLGAEAQNRVLEDYLEWANEAGLDPGTATGRWQGISIPMKGMRIDMRRARINRNQQTGRLEHAGTDHRGVLLETANSPMHELIRETPGAAEAIHDSILASYNARENGQEAATTYHNLKRYAEGAAQGPAAQQAANLQAGTTGQSGPNAFSSGGSAAWRNHEAAKMAVAQLEQRMQQDAQFRTWIQQNTPHNLADFQ